MNIKKDILEEYDRDIYYARIEFAEMLMQDKPYRKKISRLKALSKKITLLISSKKTFEALFNSNNTEQPQEENGLPQ
jgi:dihydropteroate synthase